MYGLYVVPLKCVTIRYGHTFVVARDAAEAEALFKAGQAEAVTVTDEDSAGWVVDPFEEIELAEEHPDGPDPDELLERKDL